MESVWQPAVSFVSQLFQSGSFAFMRYNNRLSLLSWQSAPRSSAAYGIVWSESHKKPGTELKILRSKKVLSSAVVTTCLLRLRHDAVVPFPSFKTPYKSEKVITRLRPVWEVEHHWPSEFQLLVGQLSVNGNDKEHKLFLSPCEVGQRL